VKVAIRSDGCFELLFWHRLCGDVPLVIIDDAQLEAPGEVLERLVKRLQQSLLVVLGILGCGGDSLLTQP